MGVGLVESLAAQNADDGVVRIDGDRFAIFRDSSISESTIAIGDARGRVRANEVCGTVGGRVDELTARHFNRGFSLRVLAVVLFVRESNRDR